jgi:hypothetical protein
MADKKSASVEWAQLVFAVVAGVFTAEWALQTWTSQQHKDLERERARLDALYINPFILAADQLRSRFDNLLDRDGRTVINAHYNNLQDGAADTVFLIAQYFAWERIIYRYGPYAHDPTVIDDTKKIRDMFAKEPPACGAFCFFRTEQKGLGHFVTIRGPGEDGAEFAIENFFTFAREIENASGPLSASKAVRATMDALENLKGLTQSRVRA